MKLNSIFILALFIIFQTIEVGIMDSLELFLGNEQVFRIHNFPDILNMRYNLYDNTISKYFYAFWSGVICSWPLLIVFIVKIMLSFCFTLNIRKKSLVFTIGHILIFLGFTCADLITLFTFDQEKGNCLYCNYLFRNHSFFYIIHTLAEISSLLLVIISFFIQRNKHKVGWHRLSC